MLFGEVQQGAFDIEISGPRAVVRFDRDLDLASAREAHAAVDRVLADPAVSRVCVDLCAARFVDSTGMAVIVRLLDAMRDRSGRVIVATESPAILRVIDLLGLASELDLVADGEAAMALAGS